MYPNRCPFCGKIIEWDGYYCGECAEKGLFTPYDDGNDSFAFIDEFTAVCVYDETVKPIIRDMKENSSGYAVSAVAKLMSDKISQRGMTAGIDVITYVPMFRKDEHIRGYNQAKLIAREISELTAVPLVTALKKPKRTEYDQKDLDFIQRRENIKGAFAVSENISGKRVLLIDDIATTGATISEAAKVLKNSGALYTAAAVFAKTKSRS